MRRAYLIFPLLAGASFAGYYAHWQSSEASQHPAPLRPDAYLGRNGELEAHGDLRAGKYVTLSYGLPARWFPEYCEILDRNYGIHVRTVAGCEVTQPLLDYTKNYNRVMDEQIVRRFGADVFDVAAQKAKILYAQRHALDVRT